MSLPFRNEIRSGGSQYKFPQPIHDLDPMHIVVPLLIHQVRPFLMLGRVCNTTVKMIEIPCLFQDGRRTQSMRLSRQMYLLMTTSFHRLLGFRSSHPNLPANACENVGRYLRAHPPNFVGNAIQLHIAQVNDFPSLCQFHRNLEHIFCIVKSIP